MIHGYVPFVCRRYGLVRSFTMLLATDSFVVVSFWFVYDSSLLDATEIPPCRDWHVTSVTAWGCVYLRV